MNWEHEYIQKQAWGRLAIGGLAAGGAMPILNFMKKHWLPIGSAGLLAAGILPRAYNGMFGKQNGEITRDDPRNLQPFANVGQNLYDIGNKTTGMLSGLGSYDPSIRAINQANAETYSNFENTRNLPRNPLAYPGTTQIVNPDATVPYSVMTDRNPHNPVNDFITGSKYLINGVSK